MKHIANPEAAKVEQPGEQSLHFPAALITPQRTPILAFVPVAAIRSDHLDPSFPQLLVQAIAVVGFVPDQPLWLRVDEPTIKSLFDKSYFVRGSTFDMYGDRKTRAVCDCHDLGPLAPLGFADTEPPFLAGTKVPSMKASERSMPPRFSRSSAKVRRIAAMVPSRTHCWNRRWQVWCGGYRSGRSFHGAPVRSTQRIPWRTSRESRQGRPRPSSRRGGSGISGLTMAHCSSVRSMETMIPDLGMLVQNLDAFTRHGRTSSSPIYETASSGGKALL